jgi:exodeoxyribonuclease III
MMKVATWNVNSINIRLPQVLAWLVENQIDVLAVQETKVVNELFPVSAFQEIGYQVSFSGQKSYNGVAIISRIPITDVCIENIYFQDEACRIMAATMNGIRLVNLYVPNGQSPGSDKYHYKLTWLGAMQQFLHDEMKTHARVMVVGDFNIAPTDLDVHDPVAWDGCVLVSPEEREALQAILAIGFVDSLRHFEPEAVHYTWWDYRQGAFRRNHGVRIDHILVSESLLSACQRVVVDKLARKVERPSDHAPVWIEFE